MLDKSIIDEFVKTTARRNTNVQPPKVTMIGTVVVSGGKNYVTIDGSTELTPVTTTTKLNDGDRVTINISNHQAMVTGNLTAPSVDKNTVDGIVSDQITEFEIIIADEIIAQNGKIDNLISDNVFIKDTLTATNANIENLIAENVTINGVLDVNTAIINDLKVNKIDAETANLTFATIESLEASRIEVNDLKANFGSFANLTS